MQNAECKKDGHFALCILHCAFCISSCSSGVIFSSACSSQDRAGSSPPSSTGRTQRPSLRPVSLPDLTSAGESARAQIRERYESLRQKIDNTEVPALELATAYGDLGKVLAAAEYIDAAEPCFLNAQALQPTEIRWPYYLGQLARSRNEPAKAVPFFEQSLRLQPDDVPSLIWLGEMHLTQNRPDAARAALHEGVVAPAAVGGCSVRAWTGCACEQGLRSSRDVSRARVDASRQRLRVCNIRWRWRTEARVTNGRPKPTCGEEATSTFH